MYFISYIDCSFNLHSIISRTIDYFKKCFNRYLLRFKGDILRCSQILSTWVCLRDFKVTFAFLNATACFHFDESVVNSPT